MQNSPDMNYLWTTICKSIIQQNVFLTFISIILTITIVITAENNEQINEHQESLSMTIAELTTEITPNISSSYCSEKYDNISIPKTEIYCNSTWDTILCWPPTPSGTLVRQKCPLGNGIDTTKFAERRCAFNGQWEGTLSNEGIDGWTNYTPCFTTEMYQLIKKLYTGGNKHIVKMKILIAERTRTLEIVGFTISLVSLLISLFIFCYFRRLNNNRTKIHKNLFMAMIIQVLIRLVLYFDQAILRNDLNTLSSSNRLGIDNTPYLCEGSYILLEYARTAMFMWMFIEGLYLHNLVTIAVLRTRFPHFVYTIIGWGIPIILTSIWAYFTRKNQMKQKCWWGYNLTPNYWILEGPRLVFILFNFIFLLNIIRVLINKLRQTRTTELQQTKKAVRAAFVLLPLLGITNILNMTEAPIDKTVWEFAIWSYATHFLRSFQGFFIAIIYCLTNEEVREVLMKKFNTYSTQRDNLNFYEGRASI